MVRNLLLLPLLDLVPRTLIVEPITAAVKRILSTYLAVTAFFTNRAIQYYLLITYIMPVADYFVSVYRSIEMWFLLMQSKTIQFVLKFVTSWPLTEVNQMIQISFDAMRAFLGNGKVLYALRSALLVGLVGPISQL